ncbi:unnamed protein product [Closterium sp. NIES-53]
MASLRVLTFNHESRPIQFDTWLDDLQLYLLSDSRDSVSLFDHTSGAAPAPPATADSATRSQWLTRDAAARLAVRNHLQLAERAHFGQHKTAKALYDTVVARYSSPATAALGRLILPYLFPELSAFVTIEDFVTHLRTSDTRYRAALLAEFLDTNPPSMYITLYFILTRLPDSLRDVRDHFPTLDPTDLTVDLLEKHLLAAENSVVTVGAARGTPRTPFFEGMSGLHLLLVGSAAAARARVARVVAVAAGVVVVEAVEAVEVAEVVAAVGVVVGVGASVAVLVAAVGVGVAVVAAVGVVVAAVVADEVELFSGEVWRWPETGRGVSGGSVRCLYFIRTSDHASQTCGKFHTQHRCFSRIDDAWRAEFGDKAERPRCLELLRSEVDIFALDYDAILAAMYALSVSAEGDCYLCVPPDPSIEATALGASESALPCTAPGEALHTFTLDSGASCCFFRDSTTLIPLPAPVPIRLAKPSGGPVLARSSTVLPCPAVLSRSLLGLHLPSFSTNLVSTAALQDAMVTTTTPGGQRVAICTCTWMGRHVATFTRRPGSSLYTLTVEPPQVAASAQVSASGPVAAPCPRQWIGPQVLLPAVRLQLRERFREDLPILHLHSVRGGEFSSDRLRNFCRGEGILQSFTLSASLQKNGVAERRIGLVMEVARTSMIHAVALHFLWLFAVRYVANQRNLWPRVSLPKTLPTLRWTGKVGGAPVFRVWGARPFVRDTSFYHPTSHRIVPSQDVTFDESVPFYRPVPLGVSQVNPLPGTAPVEVAVDSGVSRGDASGGAASGSAEHASAEPGAAEREGAEPGGAESEGAESGGAEPRGAGGSAAGGTRAGGAGAAGPRGARTSCTGAAGAGGVGGAGARDSGAGGTRAGDLGAGGAGARGTGAGGAGASSPGCAGVSVGAGVTGGAGAAGPGGARTRGTGAAGAGGVRGAGAGDPGVGCSGAGDPGAGGAGAGDPGARGTDAGGVGVGGAGAGGARARGAGARGAGAGGAGAVGAGSEGIGAGDPGAGGVGAGVAGGGGLDARGTVQRRPFFVPPHLSSLPPPDSVLRQVLKSRLASLVRAVCTGRRVPRPRPPPVLGTHIMALPHAASPTVPCLLATIVSNPSYESTDASALVAELVDFAAACRLDYATSLVAKSESDCPPSVGDIPTPRSYAEAVTGPYSSQWQTAMDAEMASRKSTRAYVDAVPPSWANIVYGMWIFRVKRPPGSPPVFKARYIARGFSHRRKVDFFHTFSPTPKMTTLRVLLHVAAQRDYELHSLEFNTAFLQGSVHEEIWLRRPPGFFGSFPACTQCILQQPVYGLRQAPREWNDTLRTTLANLGFAPSTADPSLFLRTDTSLPPVLRPRVLQRFGFQYSLPQSTPLPTSHSLSAPPSDECVEPSGPYPELVGCLTYLMICTRLDLAYPLSILARYVAPGSHGPEHWEAAKRVLRFLCSTSSMVLVLGGRGPVVLTGHTDASRVDELATQRSSQGYTFSLGSGSVSWRAMAAQELRWLTYLGERPRSSPVLYVDNKAMIALCQEERLEHRTKHISLCYFLSQDLQQHGQLCLAYVATRANTAGIFTKALPPGDHQLRFLAPVVRLRSTQEPWPQRSYADTLAMALRPSSVPLRVPLPPPPESSLPAVPYPESGCVRAASPPVSRLLATVVTDPSFESTGAFALVAEFVDFAAACPLDYATALVAESESATPPSVGGECALRMDVLEDRQEDFVCLAAAVPRFASMLLAPEGDPDAPDIPTPRSCAEAIAVPPSRANIVDGMWIFRVKRPPGSPPAFKRDYELHSLGFSTAFLQGSLHEEIWLRRPPGFTGSFLANSRWSLRRPVYGLHQVPREWHNTLRTTLAALGFTPSTPNPSLFLLADTTLPLFYTLVYVNDLVFATSDTETLTLVKSELQKRHTCTNLGELCSYLGLHITRDRARCTITLTLSHMVHQVLQRFGFQFSSPQPTPLSTGHSLSAPPSDESVEPSGPYPELVGCLMYLMTCTRPDLAYPLNLLARYVALGRHRKVHWDAAKRVLHYLCSTSGMGLVLGGRGRVVLSGHADASWVDDSATQRTSQGYTFSLGSGSVSWQSTRSSSVLSSSCEAEIYVGAMAAQELHWLTYLLTELGEQPSSPPVLYIDNKVMLALCKEHRLEHRTKHIALRYFLARELQQRGQLRLAYVATRANTADIFTKALPPSDHQRFSTVLGLVPTLPYLLTA